MKKGTFIFAAAAMMLSFSSCSEQDAATGSESAKLITVSTSIGHMTRMATDEKGAQTFTEGDEISVYAWTGSADVAPAAEARTVNNAINKLTGKVWVATPQMLWKNQKEKHYFIGIYPTRKVEDLAADTHTLQADNQEASDLLIAVNAKGLSYENNASEPVQLDFSHVMAKIVVNLTFKNQWGGIPEVKTVAVKDAAREATVNYLTKTVTPKAADETITPTAKADLELPATTANTCYQSVIIPQNDIQKLAIIIGDKTFSYNHGTPFKFESGKITTINLEVGRDKVILDEVKISDWETGSTFSGEALD